MITIRVVLLTFVCGLLGAVPVGAQSLGSLFTALPSDFAHLFTPSSAIIFSAGGGGSLAVHPFDDDIAAHFESGAGTSKDAFRPGHVIGGATVQGALAAGAYVLGRALHRERIGRSGADLIDAQIVNLVLTHGIKLAASRRRPNGSLYSFPSGHTSTTFATAAVVQAHYGWKVAAPFYGIAGYVGVSRMVDRQHFVSDVVFGAAVGLASGHAASVGHGPHRLSVRPDVFRGGIMLVGSFGR